MANAQCMSAAQLQAREVVVFTPVPAGPVASRAVPGEDDLGAKIFPFDLRF
jgi:hypothetical protein